MTNYPAEYAPHPLEFPLGIRIKIFLMALGFMTWNPQMWARYTNICVDLPSAWWIACHAYEYEKECRNDYDDVLL